MFLCYFFVIICKLCDMISDMFSFVFWILMASEHNVISWGKVQCEHSAKHLPFCSPDKRKSWKVWKDVRVSRWFFGSPVPSSIWGGELTIAYYWEIPNTNTRRVFEEPDWSAIHHTMTHQMPLACEYTADPQLLLVHTHTQRQVNTPGTGKPVDSQLERDIRELFV